VACTGTRCFAAARIDLSGMATASITLDTYGHLFPSEMEALADRLEQARTAALVNRERTQRGPVVLKLNESAGG
jgi:hypothetical protein